MHCSNTVKTYLNCQCNIIKLSFTFLYIDLLVTTGGIEPFLRNVDYPSMVVIIFITQIILIIITKSMLSKKTCRHQRANHHRSGQVHRPSTDMIIINPHMQIWGRGQNKEEVN